MATSDITSREALLQFCAALLREPHRVRRVNIIATRNEIVVQPHAHPDVLQLDLAVGSEGEWRRDGAKWRIQGASAAAFYPGQVHGYSVQSRQPGGELFSLKLEVDAAWPAIEQRLFAPLAQGLAGAGPLMDALRRMDRLCAGPQPAPLGLAALVEVLCLWPAAQATAGQPVGVRAIDAPLRAALDCIDARLAQPPTVAELAGIVHFSERHFARHFRAALGCTVHDYITARRLARATELLAQGQLSITAIAAALGFSSVHTFTRWFRLQTGSTPTAYRDAPTLL